MAFTATEDTVFEAEAQGRIPRRCAIQQPIMQIEHMGLGSHIRLQCKFRRLKLRLCIMLRDHWQDFDHPPGRRSLFGHSRRAGAGISKKGAP